ncbi:PAS domain S-box protein [Pedobacter polaris]|uniref:histidine kinase n=1 Tax=Pedobacter polaris TaxID=2571273 RepID=A0A4U1CQW6_9SPHI|nr:PAS domain S-box protein [Pedobacter polaris]TKC10421.1 PAS domain S-box protein [Pedobacter polaris]
MEKISTLIEHILAVSPLPTAIVDTNMRYLAASEKWISFYNLHNTPLIGRSHYEVFPEISDRWKEIHAQCLQGKDQNAINDRFERADGSVMYLKWEVRHFLGDDGKIAGMMMTSEDVTVNNDVVMNENRFQLFMNHFPGLAWIAGADGVLKYANKCFYDTLHLTPDVVGKKSEEIFGHEIGMIANYKIEQALEKGQGIDFQQTVRDQQGHPKVYKIYKFPFADENSGGRMVGAIAFDITKSTLLRQELDKSEAQFKLAFEHSLIGMALISPEGNWKRVNKSLCQMLGYTEKEIKALSIKDITHPDDLEKTASMLSDFATGKMERTKYEKRYLHKNGNVIWVIIAATMLHDYDGTPLYYVSQIEDITKRKEIENDLVLSEKKYRTIFENVQDVFYQTDHQGLVTEISPSIEQYSGYPRHEIIGKPVANFYFYPQDRERIIESLRTHGFVIDFEVRLKTSDQELRYASVNARLIVENGVIVATEGSMRDVTTRKFQENALKALNSELTASNEQKSKLLSIIGHDLRNPIAGSLQLLSLTIDDLPETDPEQLQNYLLAMKRELSSANDLLEDLLKWAKSQFNSVTFNPIKIDNVQQLLNKCIQTVEAMAIKKNIEVVIELKEPIDLEADRAMLETIIRNLLTNAIKFTPVKGKVTIAVATNERGIRFSVSDTGVGISKEQLALLFNQTSLSTFGTEGEKGTGLGLGLCYDFVARHKGQIWAESEVGKGSSFFFTLPPIEK